MPLNKIQKLPEEFDEWLEEIEKEWESIKGFKINRTDILRNMVKQFKGKFII
jgi:DNA-binding ferritin-like protein (Dps family)